MRQILVGNMGINFLEKIGIKTENLIEANIKISPNSIITVEANYLATGDGNEIIEYLESYELSANIINSDKDKE